MEQPGLYPSTSNPMQPQLKATRARPGNGLDTEEQTFEPSNGLDMSVLRAQRRCELQRDGSARIHIHAHEIHDY
uniref:Uncharacterized protein n=1 Tax=Oryza meridionalis TaxID=40149 RepID=A0A0E0EUK2_9ORYZ